MPNPTMSDLHVSSALTNVSVAYSQRRNFKAPMIFPAIPVSNQANKYFLYDRADLFRPDAKPRAPGTESAGGGWRVSKDSYVCDRVAIHHDVDDPTRANADPAVANLDADAAEYVTEQIGLKEEIDWVANFFTTGIWDGASSSTDMTGQAAPATTTANFRQWNDVASTPIEDIDGEIAAVASKTGYRPNGFAMGANVWRHLKNHPDILDRIKHTERGIVTEDLLAALLGLDRVDVLWGVKNTAAEGNAGAYSFIAGKNALLYYRPPTPALKVPSAGYTFVWTGNTGTPLQGARIKTFRLERNESDRVEGERWYAQKVVGSSLGAFFASCTA